MTNFEESSRLPGISPFGLCLLVGCFDAVLGYELIPHQPYVWGFCVLLTGVGVGAWRLLERKQGIFASVGCYLLALLPALVFCVTYHLTDLTRSSLFHLSLIASWALIQIFVLSRLYLAEGQRFVISVMCMVVVGVFIFLSSVLILTGQTPASLTLYASLNRLLWACALCLWSWCSLKDALPSLSSGLMKKLQVCTHLELPTKFQDEGRSQKIGWALGFLALSLSLGEGLSMGVCGLLLLLMLTRSKEKTPLRSIDLSLRPIGLSICVWLLAMLSAGFFFRGAQFELRRLGQLTPLLAAWIVFSATRHTSRKYLRTSVSLFYLSLGLSCVFGWVIYSLSAAGEPSHAWLQEIFKGTNPQGLSGDRFLPAGFFMHRLRMSHVVLVAIAALLSHPFVLGLCPKGRLSYRHLATGLALLLLFSWTISEMRTRAALIVVLVLCCVALAIRIGLWAGPLLSGLRSLARLSALCFLMSCFVLVTPIVCEKLAQGLPASTLDPFVNGRDKIWAVSASILEEHPWGVGYGQYRYISKEYYAKQRREGQELIFYRDHGVVFNTHNVLLTAWVEGGPLGLLSYIAIWLSLIGIGVVVLMRFSELSDAWDQRWAAQALVGISCAALLLGMFHDPFFHKEVALAFMGGIAFCLGYLKQIIEPQASG
jgi:hypothetical protein